MYAVSVPYNKFMAIYSVRESINGYNNYSLEIVSLGNLKSPKPCVITENAYAFKIFPSQLELDEVAAHFIDSPEAANSVTHYIGKKYDYARYYETYLKEPYSLEYANLFYIAEVAPIESNLLIPLDVARFSRSRIISENDARKLCRVITHDTLCDLYDVKKVF